MLEMGLTKKIDETVGPQTLIVEQVQILDEEGNMKIVYPSRADLLGTEYKVVRDY